MVGRTLRWLELLELRDLRGEADGEEPVLARAQTREPTARSPAGSLGQVTQARGCGSGQEQTGLKSLGHRFTSQRKH